MSDTRARARKDDPTCTIEGFEKLVAALPAAIVTSKRYPKTGHGIFRDSPRALADTIGFVLADG